MSSKWDGRTCGEHEVQSHQCCSLGSFPEHIHILAALAEGWVDSWDQASLEAGQSAVRHQPWHQLDQGAGFGHQTSPDSLSLANFHRP